MSAITWAQTTVSICQMPQAELVWQQQKLSYSTREKKKRKMEKKTLQVVHIIVERCLTRFLTVKIMTECRQVGVDTTYVHWLKMVARLERVNNNYIL